jgi:hypothetical protein
MANWKKIIVSGSQAHLAAVSASNLTDTNLLIAGPSGAIIDSGLTLSSNSLNLGAVSVSASVFTGSFVGDGTGLTGLVTTLTVSGSTGDGTVDLQTESLSILGTTNEVETSVTGQTVTIGLPDNVSITQNLTVGGDLIVQGTTTSLNTQDLFIEDKFIVLASGSVDNTDAGIIVDRGSYGLGNIAYGFDATLSRWGYQNGLTDTTNAISFDTLTAGVADNAFAAYAFTEATHGATKPTSGEFLQLGALYVASDEDIWIYS